MRIILQGNIMQTKIVAILEKYHLKVTPQRTCIVKNLLEGGHLTIDELYEKVKETCCSLSLATIYKNVNRMIEEGALSEVKIDGEKSYYEITKEAHNHFVCSNCGRIVDLFNLTLNDKKLFKGLNMKVEAINFVAYGECAVCNGMGCEGCDGEEKINCQKDFYGEVKS